MLGLVVRLPVLLVEVAGILPSPLWTWLRLVFGTLPLVKAAQPVLQPTEHLLLPLTLSLFAVALAAAGQVEGPAEVKVVHPGFTQLSVEARQGTILAAVEYGCHDRLSALVVPVAVALTAPVAQTLADMAADLAPVVVGVATEHRIAGTVETERPDC